LAACKMLPLPIILSSTKSCLNDRYLLHGVNESCGFNLVKTGILARLVIS
jgi:hypothetical protein